MEFTSRVIQANAMPTRPAASKLIITGKEIAGLPGESGFF
jgi:hypothetical protein